MSRRLLQTVNLAIALLTLFLAGSSLIFGAGSPVYAGAEIPEIPVLDSNLRFMGGMGLGIALALIWITPRIETHNRIQSSVDLRPAWRNWPSYINPGDRHASTAACDLHRD